MNIHKPVDLFRILRLVVTMAAF